MAQTELKMRVRPSKVAVLLGDAADAEQFRLAIRFLSRLWGGRFCPIFPVPAAVASDQGRRWLASARPDLVYGVAVDCAVWGPLALEACQPRGYDELAPECVDAVHAHHQADLITALPVLHWLRQHPGDLRRPVVLVGCPEPCVLRTIVETMFGWYDPLWVGRPGALRQDPPRLIGPDSTTADLVRLCADFARSAFHSWLDVANHGLNVRIEGSMPLPPTVVLVESTADLALAWNLRTTSDSVLPQWVLPLLATDAVQSDVLDALMEWVDAFRPYGARPNFFNVTSLTANPDLLRAFAEALRPRLAGAGIVHVDVQQPVEESR
jgi:hypothetical protein